MSPALAGLLLAAALAALDLALRVGPKPAGWRRLLRGAPAAVLGLTARALDAPVLLPLALIALGVADAVAADASRELGSGETALTAVALLLTAALLFELGDPARLFAEPWRAAGGAAVALGGGVLTARRPALRAGPVGALAPLIPACAALAALAAGVTRSFLWPAMLGVALLALASGWNLARRDGSGVSRVERALRSAGVLAIGWAFFSL